MERDDVVGRPTGSASVVIERGPVAKFADAVHNDSPLYQDAGAARAAGFDDLPIPPTYTFSAARYWGVFPGDQPPDPTNGTSPTMEIIGALRATGGMILHGEQEFTYHRPIVAGERLSVDGQVVDLYTKASSSGAVMTFFVTEDVYRDAAGEPVLTQRMNLVHRT